MERKRAHTGITCGEQPDSDSVGQLLVKELLVKELLVKELLVNNMSNAGVRPGAPS